MQQTARGTATHPSRSATPRGRRVWPSGLLRVVLIVLIVLALWVVVDLGSALVPASQDSVAARTAEWARSRGLGDLVSWTERVAYELNPPPTGGAPSAGVPIDAKPVATGSTAVGPCGSQTMPTPAGAALPNEGSWQPIATVRGKDAILATFVRPDASHTRFLAGITCTNQSLARFTLHPGTQVPGGSGWAQQPTVAGSLNGMLATFNSGFLMADSHGGFWMKGKASGRLVAGQASMVFGSDGRLDIRAWEGGTPSTEIAAVRQNLVLLVDGGQLSAAVQHADSGAFGKTLGDTTYVWRSGIGIRADGSIVTVHGNALSVKTLAVLLKDAGAVRAMQLDINRDWTSYIYYRHSAGSVTPRKLTSDQIRPANRYLQISTRDFVAVQKR